MNKSIPELEKEYAAADDAWDAARRVHDAAWDASLDALWTSRLLTTPAAALSAREAANTCEFARAARIAAWVTRDIAQMALYKARNASG
jgi:hypothetical protein